jgi:hypothetical protein
MSDWCIHIANLFYLASFLGRDMLWLRALTCAGLLFGIIFFSCQPMPLYGPTVWSVLFLGINVVQIRGLIAERRRLRLSAEQERAAEAAFRKMSREEMLTVLTHGLFENQMPIENVEELRQAELSQEEQVLRDIAFSRLSRTELLNLLIRRLWNSMTRLNPIKS